MMKRRLSWPTYSVIYKILGLFAAVLFVCALGWGCMRLMRTTSYTISYDNRFSGQQRVIMQKWLSKCLYNQPFSVTQEQLYSNFLTVERVKRSHKSWGHAHVKIAARPISVICNTEHAITPNRLVVPAQDYADVYKNSIAQLQVLEEKNIMQDQSVLLEFTQRVPAALVRSYRIVWHDPTRIELNHTDGNVQVLVMHSTPFTDQLCTALDTWVRQGKKVCIDVRYEGQIVVHDREQKPKGRTRL